MNLTTSKDQIEAQILASVKSTEAFSKHRFSALSKTYTIIRALSNAIFIFIESVLLDLQNSIHPQTASGRSLEDWLTRYDMQWKQPVSAIYEVRIGSSAPVEENIEIPQGLVVSTPNGEISFRVLTSAILPAGVGVDVNGFYTIPLQAECLTAGIIGNIPSMTISEIDSPTDGLNVVYNPSSTPILAGEEKETVASVRNRIKNKDAAKNAFWTPDWYISEAETFDFVKRAIFISAKKLNSPGFVKLLLLGVGNSPVSVSNLNLVKDTLNSEDKNPGGVAIVLVDNINYLPVNKTINVYFKNEISIASQETLDNVLDEYFNSLLDAQAFKDSDIRYLYFQLPDVVNVQISPDEDIFPGENILAVKGSISINGLVYGL